MDIRSCAMNMFCSKPIGIGAVNYLFPSEKARMLFELSDKCYTVLFTEVSV